MKAKKILLIIICILIIIIAIWAIREFVVCHDFGLNKSNPMSKEEVLNLLKKGSEYPNYYCTYTDDSNSKYEIYVKDNTYTFNLDGELMMWENYNTNESIMIFRTKDNTIAGISNDAHKEEYSQIHLSYTPITTDEYKYLGEKEQDGRQVIYIETNDNGYIEKYVIDKETGLIVNKINYYKRFLIFTVKSESKRDIKLDIVTDENVARPDLSSYTVLESE